MCIRDSFENVLSEEMKELYRQLEKMMEQVDKQQLEEQLKEMKLGQEDVEKELARALEMFKRMEVEQKTCLLYTSRLGAIQYLTKPVGITELLAAFARAQQPPLMPQEADFRLPSLARAEWEYILSLIHISRAHHPKAAPPDPPPPKAPPVLDPP